MSFDLIKIDVSDFKEIRHAGINIVMELFEIFHNLFHKCVAFTGVVNSFERKA